MNKNTNKRIIGQECCPCKGRQRSKFNRCVLIFSVLSQQSRKSAYSIASWVTGCLAAWVAGWLVVWPAGWPAGWQAGRLAAGGFFLIVSSTVIIFPNIVLCFTINSFPRVQGAGYGDQLQQKSNPWQKIYLIPISYIRCKIFKLRKHYIIFLYKKLVKIKYWDEHVKSFI